MVSESKMSQAFLCNYSFFFKGTAPRDGYFLSLPPVSWTPVSTTPAELVAKFAAGGVDTSGKFSAGVFNAGWCTLTFEYLREFSQKI